MTNERAQSELAERCEKATGPDRELDKAIEEAVFRGVEFRVDQPLPAYTASLDAAMTLVPEGWLLVKLSESARETYPKGVNDAPWSAQLKLPSDDLRAKWGVGLGQTPALALCAAALRARSQ